MKKRYGFAAAAISAAFALSVTACGGDSSSSSEGPTKVSKVDDLSTECEDGDEALVGEEEVLYTCTDGKWASEEAKSSASKPKSSSSKVEDSDEEECDEDLENCDDDDTSSSSIAKSSASKGDSGDKGGSGSGDKGGSGSGEEGGSGSGEEGGSGSGEEGGSGSGEEGGSGSGEEGGSGSGEENNPYAFDISSETVYFGSVETLENEGLQNGGNCKYTVTQGNLDNVIVKDLYNNEIVSAEDFANHGFPQCNFSIDNRNATGSDLTLAFKLNDCNAYECDGLTDEIRDANTAVIKLASGQKPVVSAEFPTLEYGGNTVVSVPYYLDCTFKVAPVSESFGQKLPTCAASSYNVSGANVTSLGSNKYSSTDCQITIENNSSCPGTVSLKVQLTKGTEKSEGIEVNSTESTTLKLSPEATGSSSSTGSSASTGGSSASTTITVPSEYTFLNDYVTWTAEKSSTTGKIYIGTYVGLGTSTIEKQGYTCGALGQSKTETDCIKKINSSTSSVIVLDTKLHKVTAGVVKQET